MAANALAPYAAQLIGSKFDQNHGSDPNATLQMLSHALLGALLAEVNGGNAASGAGAAVGGELAAKLLTEALYPGYTGELNDQQKQTILALSQAVAAVAGSNAGDGLAGTALAAGIAKNVVENNYLSAPQRKAKDADRAACGNDSACLQATDARWAEVSQEQSRDIMERYASYLTPEEQYALFSLKPGTKEYDQILAGAIARKASNLPAHMGTLLNREIGLLRETDWDGALFGPLAPGMSVSDRNRIEMALLGPIFGMPSATLTAFGADPQKVALVNHFGMLGWDLAGAGFIFRPKSARGPFNVDGGSTKVVQTESLPLTGRKPGLEGLGPNALDFSGGTPSFTLLAQSKGEVARLADMYNKASLMPKDFTLNLGGSELKADPLVSKGSPVFTGASTADVMAYFQTLGGINAMPAARTIPGKGQLYVVTTPGGATLRLRDFSSSSEATGAKWTIDIVHSSINGGRAVEMKFK